MRFLLGTLLFAFAFSHELSHRVEQEGSCALVYFFFQDGSPFNFEEYEVYREGENTPFQKGRSDALGRVVFCPDRDGLWQLKIASQDGHGAILNLKLQGKRVLKERGLVHKYTPLISGLGYLLGIFGLVALLLRRKNP